MNPQQLSLFHVPSPPEDTLYKDASRVASMVKFEGRPLTSTELQKLLPELSKDRIYHALSLLHKQGEIGWMSRATWEENSRATCELETKLQEQSSRQVARPKSLKVARPKLTLKVKAFLKGGSDNRFYYWLCKGNLRLAYIGGRVGSVEGRQNKSVVELAIAQGRFEGCQTHADYKAVINQVKLEAVF